MRVVSSFTNPSCCTFLASCEVVSWDLGSIEGRASGGGGDYCLSCVDQIISVFRICSRVIASPPSLCQTHTPGTAERRVILHILCGGKKHSDCPHHVLVTKSHPRKLKLTKTTTYWLGSVFAQRAVGSPAASINVQLSFLMFLR